MHLITSPIDWYAARAAGIAAYVLLSAVVTLGLTMSSGTVLKRWPRFALEDVHRFGGLLVGTFIGIHVLTVGLDAFLPFPIASLVVPFLATYRPLAVALGIVAAEMLLALAVTNHYRKRMPRRYWRAAHYANFAVWTLATAHGLSAGTDRSTPWFLAVEVAAVAAVTGGTVLRVCRRRKVSWGRPAAAATALAASALVVGLAAGPLGFHAKEWNAKRFDEPMTGQIVRQLGRTRGIVSLAGNGTGRQRVLVRADLLISPGHVADTSFQMEFLPSGLICRGQVTHVEAYAFAANCTTPDGLRRFVSASWQPTQTSAITGGRISAHV